VKVFLYQSPNGYCYNSDTIFLFDFLSQFKLKGKILDVGTGVGVLATLIGKYFSSNIWAVEKQEIMYKYAKKNFEVNNIDVNLIKGDFLDFYTDEKFDFVVSNPPFYKVDKNKSKNECISIARYEENLPLEQFIQKVSKIVTPKGYFGLCYDASHTDEVLSLLKKYKFQPEFIRFVHPKAENEANIVMIMARRNSRAVCRVLAPLIVFNRNNSYTKTAKKAFLKANTHSIKAFYD